MDLSTIKNIIDQLDFYFSVNPNINRTPCGHERGYKIKCDDCLSINGTCKNHIKYYKGLKCKCKSGVTCDKCCIVQKSCPGNTYCIICELKTTLYRSNLSEKTYESIFESKKNKDSRKLIMHYMDLLGFLARPGNKLTKVKVFRGAIKDFFPTTVVDVEKHTKTVTESKDFFMKENHPPMSTKQMLDAGYDFDIFTGEQINPYYVKIISHPCGYDGYTGLPLYHGFYQKDVDAAMYELFPNNFSHKM